jgi:hypothetical protein
MHQRDIYICGLKWVATLPLGDINAEDWSSGIGLGVGLPTLPCKKKKIIEKHPRNSAGFCGGGQGLSWAVEPRKEGLKYRFRLNTF